MRGFAVRKKRVAVRLAGPEILMLADLKEWGFNHTQSVEAGLRLAHAQQLCIRKQAHSVKNASALHKIELGVI
jgi:hypothetical protein